MVPVAHIPSAGIREGSLQELYVLPFAAFSAKVEITDPNVSKLYKGSDSFVPAR